jgi:uncharacterized coiled-coil protein SlyX
MAEHTSADTLIGGFLSRLRDSGEGAFNRLSEQLLENPVFLDALRRTLEAKGQVDRTISGTLDLMQLPSKNDTQRVTEMLEEISTRVAKQQRMLTQIEQDVAVVKALVERLTATRARRAPK